MSANRWGLTPGVLTSVLILLCAPAQADELDRCRTTLYQDDVLAVADSTLDLADISTAADDDAASSHGDDAYEALRDLLGRDHEAVVPMGDLQLLTDFHPETDRWTERNNRIRITLWTGAWMFSNELDIHHDVVVGFRINWEVPGFIGIRWDSGFVPWARMEVKVDPANNPGINPASSRQMDGVVHNHTLSIGIFNPELSQGDLAFWAGFGVGLWIYNFQEDDIFHSSQGGGGGGGTNGFGDGEFNDIEGILEDQDALNLSAHIFVELSYKIASIFHVGIGIRQHFILADHTDNGRFYDYNDSPIAFQSFDSGRNDGIVDDLAGVTEVTFNISVLF